MLCPGYWGLDLDVCSQITQLKIAANPFAKGFRENGRNSKRWASFIQWVFTNCLLGARPWEHDSK